ncbi:hypothetical protein QBC35DRAFT_525433 [Podospora australis]|uniref:Uncharacterized protein n=1 Tax=Podospora australis TaxID=1536484 RepID=A0AAN7ADK1_9PEZI|nr:hypothetical protein QBC35DRAFT_525433 [Podospora australis]
MENSTEDLNTTTTTTDWDSGDSEGIDYVYDGQQCNATTTTTSSASTQKKPNSSKSKSPRRKKSPKAKKHCHKCTCEHAAAFPPAGPNAEVRKPTPTRPSVEDDDADETVFEEDTEDEDKDSQCHRPRRHSRSNFRGSESSRGCQHKPTHKDKDDKGEKKKGIATKVHRKRSPYIEEYPECPNRPAILLKEHKVPRRFSAADAKRILDWQRSASGSRGRSPVGKRQPPPQKGTKLSPKRSAHRRRRIESPEDREGEFSTWSTLPRQQLIHHTDEMTSQDIERSHPVMNEPVPIRIPRRADHGIGLGIPTPAARTSAWTEHQPELAYSSSWPLKSGTPLPLAQPLHYEARHESDGESDDLPPEEDGRFEEGYLSQRPCTMERVVPRGREMPKERRELVEGQMGRTKQMAREGDWESEAGRGRERGLERRHADRLQQPPQQPQQQHEAHRAPSLRRRRTVGGHTVGTIDQGRRSAATELCEIWRGRASDWESPYPSDDEFWSDNEDDRGPSRMLLEGMPPPHREPTPNMLPPRGHRSHFGFAPMVRPPPVTVRAPSPAPCPWPRRGRTWAGESNMANGFFLLEAPLTAEPVMMMDEAEEDMGLSVAPSRVSRAGWTYPLVRYCTQDQYIPAPPPPSHRRPRSPSRAPSPPIFVARKTKEFLSPVPTRVARFDFDAWGRDRASKSSLALAPLALVY